MFAAARFPSLLSHPALFISLYIAGGECPSILLSCLFSPYFFYNLTELYFSSVVFFKLCNNMDPEKRRSRGNFVYIVDPSSSSSSSNIQRHKVYRNEKHASPTHRTDQQAHYPHCNPKLHRSISPPPRLTIAERFMMKHSPSGHSIRGDTRHSGEKTEVNQGRYSIEKESDQQGEPVYCNVDTLPSPQQQQLLLASNVKHHRNLSSSSNSSSGNGNFAQKPPSEFDVKRSSDQEAADVWQGREAANSIQHQRRGPGQRRYRHAACAIALFTLILVVAVGVFVSWPRTPLVRINGPAMLTMPPKISKTEYVNAAGNVAFETGWLVRATIDSNDNYIPLPFAPDIVVKDALTGVVVGHLDTKQYQVVTIPPQTLTDVTLPIHVDYEARDASDTTFSNLKRGCMAAPDERRESLQLQFWITLHYPALDTLGYKPSLVALPATGGFACPQA